MADGERLDARTRGARPSPPPHMRRFRPVEDLRQHLPKRFRAGRCCDTPRCQQLTRTGGAGRWRAPKPPAADESLP
ncbi:unnamed protein product [Urochloa humidicola]